MELISPNVSSCAILFMELISPNLSSCAILLITRGVSHKGWFVIYIKNLKQTQKISTVKLWSETFKHTKFI